MKELQVNYKSALYVLRRIRSAMVQRDTHYRLKGLSNELDDAFIGGQDRGKGHFGRGTAQVPVLVAASLGADDEYPQFFRMRPVPDLSADSIKATAPQLISEGSIVKTDGWSAYNILDEIGFEHVPVVMKGLPQDAHFRWLHTVISNAKAFIDGTFHGVSKQHLGEYLDEFCYRLNRRRWEGELFHRLVTACLGARSLAGGSG
jgi:transposase-like protein